MGCPLAFAADLRSVYPIKATSEPLARQASGDAGSVLDALVKERSRCSGSFWYQDHVSQRIYKRTHGSTHDMRNILLFCFLRGTALRLTSMWGMKSCYKCSIEGSLAQLSHLLSFATVNKAALHFVAFFGSLDLNI